MKKTAIILPVLLLMGTVASAETVGDVDGDGKVGLPEVIYALQVTSGMKPQTATPTYDLSEYFYIENGEYYYTGMSYPQGSSAQDDF